MGESTNKLRSEIDVTEFERRLRAPAPSPSYGDPLAELARLVDGKNLSGDADPFRELFAQPRTAAARPAAPAASLGREHAFFADLRGSLDSNAADLPPDVIPSHAPPVDAPSAAPAETEYSDAAWEQETADHVRPARRSRKPLYAMSAIICAGLVGIGASFAMRGKAPGSQELALVKAPAGPVKVQPQNPGGVDVPNQSASILDRTAGAPRVSKVVSREEQPVDLDQQVKQMRVITLGGARDGSASTVTGQGAASVPVPPPPATSVSTSNNGFPEPKRVKTVSVRPDGSLITTDVSSSPAASDPIAALAAGRPAPAASGPDTNVAKSATPKSTARVATTPKVEAAAAPVAGDQPVATTPLPSKPKLVAAPKPKPVKVASADADNASSNAAPVATASTGGFAVQLAAPASEQEARSASAKLGAKFAEPLGGRRPSVVKAEVGDKSIYRVRVSSLSRDEAVSLCEKVKAKGGACFVAKN